MFRRLVKSALFLVFCARLSAAETDTRLLEAVKASRRAEVQDLIGRRVDVNARDVDGSTALHWAAYRNDQAVVAVLTAAGANVAAENRYGVTPLSVACETGNASIIELLLDAGADANTTSPDGETVLMTAARTDGVKAIRLLLERGADPNARERWRRQTALMWAASAGNIEIVRALIDGGADVTARSGSAAAPSPSGAAAAGPALRSTGTGGRAAGGAGLTPLLFAVRAGRIAVTKVLLESGANVNDQAPDGMSALMVATLNAHFELAAMLLDRGADATRDLGGMTPLHLALQVRNPDWERFPEPKPTGTRSSLDLIETLLTSGADPNATTSKRMQGVSGATPFILAAKAGDLEAMRLLLSKGADPRLAATDGTTALMVAAGLGFTEGKSRTTESDALKSVTLLLELDATVNAQNNAGDTALHGAAARGANEVVKLLVQRGAQIGVTNKKGLTALDATEAVADGKTVHPDTAQLLRQLGSATP